MNFIDIVALIAVGFGAFRGFQNGVIKEVTGLLGLIVGVWAGLRLSFFFADYYRDNFDILENYIPLLAFLTAFLLGVLAVWLAGKLLNKFVNSIALGLPNKLGGVVFGAAKWAFLVGTVLSLVINAQIISKETQESSVSYPILNNYCKAVQGYTIGLIPAASNVFKDVENYFVDLDSVRSTRQAPPGTIPDGENPDPNDGDPGTDPDISDPVSGDETSEP